MINKKIVCWWSGGITSAVACKLAIDFFGKDNCLLIMIDTKNEDDDTYRFKKDCEGWYGVPIITLTCIFDSNNNRDVIFVDIGAEYKKIQDVWFKYKSLNVAHGAVCSSELKRRTREVWQKNADFDHQVFGFEFDKKEINRALSISINHPNSKPIFPLLMMGYNKEDCIKFVQDAGIKIPITYTYGFRNNNCFKTGCVQGGIGYWQKMKRDFPDKFNEMANIEHDLTKLKGKPVTMLKDQSKDAKTSGNILVFLKKHPDYPELKSIDEMPDCKVEPLFECNGFCGTNDLSDRKETEDEINFEIN
jgi:hypothetical protein